MISFNTIPASFRTPGQHIEFDSSRAVSGLPPIENRVLLIGQKLAAGSAAALGINPISSASQAVALFGQGSQLARMAAAYFAADSFSEVNAIALDDAAGSAKATCTLTLTGPATAAGTIALWIAGERIAVGVQQAAIANTVAAAVAAAIAARPDLPVTAAVGGAPNQHVVTLTARNGGTNGNDIDVRHSHAAGEALPAGVGLVITAMAGGATDPVIDAVWPVIGDNPYRTIVLGVTDATTYASAVAELDSRAGSARMLESIAYGARRGTQGALAAFGAGLNSELVSILGIGSSPTCPCQAAAIYAAACGYYSAIDPARPLQTLALKGMVAPKVEARFTRAQRELLLRDGISTFTVTPAGTCLIERAITTYQTDDFGLADLSFLDLETPLTLFYLRASLRARIAQKFPRQKLAADGTRYGAGQAIVTPSTIRAELLALAREWEELGLVENLDQYKADLIVERDATDPNRINALVPPNIVNQFRAFAAAIQFRL
ncbi:phage tail sheath C-terminal domain-containing protein [Erythrobacter colymbi]|uniref:phage tail sheath C-terminal domain-containing protein n=1 Tax=Erythrobacter colymbi TaxID=1161202 RepID=UPI000A38F39C|nr:phage tail sheath C-terminal domain-containing protein [Erythrobacter colymbi]